MIGTMSAHATAVRPTGRHVYCLCAEWCGVCREWRAHFDALAVAHPQDRFVWVDVDAQEEVLDIMDIETFPVLLIAQDGAPLFCGPVLATGPVVARLMQGLQHPAANVDPAARQLLDLLQAP